MTSSRKLPLLHAKMHARSKTMADDAPKTLTAADARRRLSGRQRIVEECPLMRGSLWSRPGLGLWLWRPCWWGGLHEHGARRAPLPRPAPASWFLRGLCSNLSNPLSFLRCRATFGDRPVFLPTWLSLYGHITASVIVTTVQSAFDLLSPPMLNSFNANSRAQHY